MSPASSTEQQVAAIFVVSPIGNQAWAWQPGLSAEFKMAEGPRFPPSSFPPQNHYIPASFSGGNSSIPAKFAALPSDTFIPQSNLTSVNSSRGHAPQMFPGNQGHGIVCHNVQSFPPSFHRNNGNLQQEKQPMSVRMPEVQRHPFPSSQFATDRQATNSSPNPHSFSPQGQLQFPPVNTPMNVESNIARRAHSSSPFPPGVPQIVQNTSLQAAHVHVNHGPVPNEHSSSRTFPGSYPAPFSGPMPVPPVPAPMQFTRPLPSTTPMVHLTAPPVSQQTNMSVSTAQEMTSQEQINNFLKARGIETQTQQTPDKTSLKVCTFISLFLSKEFLKLHLSLAYDHIREC